MALIANVILISLILATSVSAKVLMEFVKQLSNETKPARSTIRLLCDAKVLDKSIKENDLEFTWYLNGTKIDVSNYTSTTNKTGTGSGTGFEQRRNSVEIKTAWKETAQKIVATMRLIIRNSNVRDSGVYSCGISHANTRVIQSYGNITIFDEPRKLILEPICQLYSGKLCYKFFENKYVFIEPGYTQFEVEEQLQNTFLVISQSKDISSNCRSFVLPGLCYTAFPMCLNLEVINEFQKHNNDSIWNQARNYNHTQLLKARSLLPIRRICRDDCELLENELCRKEYAIAIRHPVIGKTLRMEQCRTLPEKTDHNYQFCLPLGIDGLKSVKLDDSCFWNDGRDYRGTTNVTATNKMCIKWSLQFQINLSEHTELVGGHSYCRNPGGVESGPFCYVDPSKRELCHIPLCTDIIGNYVFIVMSSIIGIVATVMLYICCKKICCVDKKSSTRNLELVSLPLADNNIYKRGLEFVKIENKKHSRSAILQSIAQFSYKDVELIEEIGEGAFGKVFRGQLKKCQTSNSSHSDRNNGVMVAVKTLKENASAKDCLDFQKEIELIAELQHPNVVSLVGVIVKQEPFCMIFEFMSEGDLHDYLIKHSPHTENSSPLNTLELLHIAVQIASGMEYLADNRYIHRDLASRNCLVSKNLVVKISDFGLSRDMYSSDYYRVQSKSLLPIRWMPPEAILYGKFTVESDIWSFGVVLWEIFGFGLQPYFSYNNQEVINLIRNRELLSIPENCPSFCYGLMVECWAECPSRRPNFTEIVQRLRNWKQQLIHTHSTLGRQVSHNLSSKKSENVDCQQREPMIM